MTREEAIEELKAIKSVYSNNLFGDAKLMKSEQDALDMAIKALEQEPSGETVSLEAFKQVMWERDTAIGQLKELGYGFGQKIESCDDAISRQAVLDLAKLDGRKGLGTIIHAFDVEQLPSVNPQEPKTGHWIEKDGFDGDVYYDCSECGESWSTIEGTPWDNGMKYCPNCGCRMIEPQESEDKDETDIDIPNTDDVLDKIKTEIRNHCERYMDGDIIGDEVIRAVENIGKAESDHKCHTCKHYTSGEHDGSCGSYICEHYSGWESEE